MHKIRVVTEKERKVSTVSIIAAMLLVVLTGSRK